MFIKTVFFLRDNLVHGMFTCLRQLMMYVKGCDSKFQVKMLKVPTNGTTTLH